MKKERQIEEALVSKLQDLKYTYRPDIRDKASLEQNFREKFETLNHVKLTNTEFARLRDDIVNADVFTAAQTLREKGYFQREDGKPLHYDLVNRKDWCKNEFEIVNQLRINTDNSHHRYDVILLINGIPVVQIELKNHTIVTRRAMEQIVNYKNDPGNGYGNSLLCFMQLFIVSNENRTYYFANNRNEHFSFNAEERFLPVYELADGNNNKTAHLHEFSQDFLAKCTLGKMISRYMVLVSARGRAALSALATGTSGSMKNITKPDVLNLSVLVTNIEEQQKIADCLSSIDDLITAQTQKIEAFKAHKKGLMQQLFPAVDKMAS